MHPIVYKNIIITLYGQCCKEQIWYVQFRTENVAGKFGAVPKIKFNW